MLPRRRNAPPTAIRMGQIVPVDHHDALWSNFGITAYSWCHRQSQGLSPRPLLCLVHKCMLIENTERTIERFCSKRSIRLRLIVKQGRQSAESCSTSLGCRFAVIQRYRSNAFGMTASLMLVHARSARTGPIALSWDKLSLRPGCQRCRLRIADLQMHRIGEIDM